MRLLAIDWDYFFPCVERPEDERQPGEWMFYDWGHRESSFFIEDVWTFRAAHFLAAGLDLPGTSGLERSFWDRFDIPSHAQLFIAESNSAAANPAVADGITEVVLFDAHHDAGYGHDVDTDTIDLALSKGEEGVWECDNWMALHFLQGAKLHVHYPAWRHYAKDIEPEPWVPVTRTVDDGSPVGQVDQIFICRSGAWVPPWLDHRFLAFVEDCPVGEVTQLGDYPLHPREFDRGAAQRQADTWNAMKRVSDLMAQGATAEQAMKQVHSNFEK